MESAILIVKVILIFIHNSKSSLLYIHFHQSLMKNIYKYFERVHK
jgi:hypothetical protein